MAGRPECTGKGFSAEAGSVCRRCVLGYGLTGCVLSLYKVVALLAGFLEYMQYRLRWDADYNMIQIIIGMHDIF